MVEEGPNDLGKREQELMDKEAKMASDFSRREAQLKHKTHTDSNVSIVV